ncbi:hypothetical protein [Lamprocystis purpurea]|jgi:hypothetical protein|nr:hypothetical protein [Lamprocystis purpurea]
MAPILAVLRTPGKRFLAELGDGRCSATGGVARDERRWGAGTPC